MTELTMSGNALAATFWVECDGVKVTPSFLIFSQALAARRRYRRGERWLFI